MAKQINLKGNQAYQLIAPTQTAEGFVLVDPGDQWAWGKIIFGAVWLLIWCGVSFPMFIGFLLQFIADPEPIHLLPLLFSSFFVAIGAVGLWWASRYVLVIARLTPGRIILPTYPLRMGESCTIRYQRQLRQGRTRNPGKLTAKWICYEWVRYRQGTDIVTKTHLLQETELPHQFVSSNVQRLEYEMSVEVPSTGPASLNASNNQVRWELQVKIDVPGAPKDTSYFLVNVTPEIIQ